MYENFFKRLLDIVLSIFFIISFSPILFVLFFLVRASSPGPFIFITERIGKDRKKFNIYKIRTMTNEAGILTNDKTKKYITTFENDVRITKLGAKLRKYHLDEIPQFINVLKGDMSVVGVRPDAPSQKSDYRAYVWVNRHLFKPGITGLSQIHSNDANFDFSIRNKYDLFYSKSKNKLRLDLFILIATCLKVIKGSSF